jgi:hypothetical protein
VRGAEQLVQQEKELLDVLSGKRQPANATERIKYTGLCTLTRRYQAAARLCADAFAAERTLAGDLQAAHRYNAACAAALAAAGKNATSLTAMERLALRRQALTWLRADLSAWARLLAAGKMDRNRLAGTLTHWQKDAALVGVRDAQALQRLSPQERQACQRLWADVAALLDRAKAPR